MDRGKAARVLELVREEDREALVMSLEELYDVVKCNECLRKAVASTLYTIHETVGGVNTMVVGGFPLTVKGEYGVKRGWDTWMAYREFLQNAIDASPDGWRVYATGDTVNVLDTGPGVKPSDALLLGSSTKKCWQRGFFGEGMKIAMITLEALGYPTVITTRFGRSGILHYRIARLEDLGINVFLVAHSDSITRIPWPNAVRGTFTIASIRGVKQRLKEDARRNGLPSIYLGAFDKRLLEELGYKIVDMDIPGPTECPYTATISLVLPKRVGTEEGILWVRDIFVGKVQEALGYKSRLSYNLWWVELESNRKQATLRGRIRAQIEIERLIEHAVTMNPKLAFKILKGVEIDIGVTAGIFKTYIVNTRPVRGLIEWESLSPFMRARLIATMVKMVKEIDRIDYVDTVLPSGTLSQIAHVIGKQAGVLLVDEPEDRLDYRELARLLGAKILTEEYSRVSILESEERKPIPDTVLSRNIRLLIENIARILSDMVYVRPPKRIVLIDGRSCYIPATEEMCVNVGNIYKRLSSMKPAEYHDIKRLIEVIIHELAHHAAFRYLLEKGHTEEEAAAMSTDLTEYHVGMLQKIASNIVEPMARSAFDALVKYLLLEAEVSVLGIEEEMAFTVRLNVPVLPMMEIERIEYDYTSEKHRIVLGDRHRELISAYIGLSLGLRPPEECYEAKHDYPNAVNCLNATADKYKLLYSSIDVSSTDVLTIASQLAMYRVYKAVGREDIIVDLAADVAKLHPGILMLGSGRTPEAKILLSRLPEDAVEFARRVAERFRD